MNGGPPERESRAPFALLAALAAAILYAAFASGAAGLPEESWLQGGIAAIAIGTLAVLLLGSGLRMTPEPPALLGLGLLAGFAAWCALSMTWALAPDAAWIETNRAIAYSLVGGLALVLGSSLRHAARRVALAYLAVATLVALHAIGGKVAPWLQIGGLIDLDHTRDFARLRAPLEYWNALALFCALAVPAAVSLGADMERRARWRLAGLLALIPLLTTIALTYSRGGILVLLVALGLVVGLSRDRLRLAAAAGIGIAGIVPGVLVAVARDDLSEDGLSTAARADDGLLMLLGLVAGAAIVVFLGRALIRSGAGWSLEPRARAGARRAGLAAVGGAVLIALVLMTFSDRGLTGTISHEFDSFTTADYDPRESPERVLRTNSGNRWVWWEEAMGAASDRPVEGHGAGSFPVIHRLYREDFLDVRQPHSVPLEFLSETGLVGAGLGLGALALLGVGALRGTRARAGSERLYAAALFAGAAGWALHIWVDWDWDIPAVTLPALLFAGVLAARPRGERAPAAAAPGGRPLALAIGTALLCLFAVSAALPALSEERTSDALGKAAKGDPVSLREAAEDAEVASRLNPYSLEPLYAAASIALRRGQGQEAARFYVEAVERQPSNSGAWRRLAVFYRLLDDSPAAFRAAEVAVALDPRNWQTLAASIEGLIDEARSASATGTPLPERGVPLPAAPAAPAPTTVAPGTPTAPTAPTTPGPQAPAPAPQPSPAPAPAPPPAPAPAPPSSEPFRSEG